MFAALIPAAAGLLGGGAKGGGGGGPIKQSQDGNTLVSGTGEFNFGGGGMPPWIWPVVLGGVALAGLFIWKPWKR